MWTVIDYQKLREVKVEGVYPILNISEICDQLGNSKYFTTLDLAFGFHRVKMYPIDKAKTVFSTTFGQCEFNRLPIGLKMHQLVFWDWCP